MCYYIIINTERIYINMSSFVSRYATTTCFKTDSDNNGGLHELKKMKVKVKNVQSNNHVSTVTVLSGRHRINFWTAVATWRWIANDDNCGICRMAFDGCCPDCKLPGDDCPLVWGQCSHCFHIHCIVKWLNSQQVHQLCPMCRQEWKFKE